MDKSQIISEIRRTAEANGGIPLGRIRFEQETGINYHEWYGKFWARWSDAVREAGLEPNRMTEAMDVGTLLEKLVDLTRSLKKVPGEGELMLAGNADLMFPAAKTFSKRLGSSGPRRIWWNVLSRWRV
jgi:hypothetical protein